MQSMNRYYGSYSSISTGGFDGLPPADCLDPSESSTDQITPIPVPVRWTTRQCMAMPNKAQVPTNDPTSPVETIADVYK